MKISWHKTRAVFDRYDITSDDDIREASQKVDAYVAALPNGRTVLPLTRAGEPFDTCA